MKKYFSLFLSALIAVSAFSQEEEPDNRPERPPFETSILIDNHTVVTPYKGGFEFEIYHRFGKVTNGITDIYGIYAPSNIRLGLKYGITDKIMVGFGTTKDYKLQDFQWKYAILQQTRSGSIPVSLSYCGNMVIDARGSENFGPEDGYRKIHRLSYFTQLIAAHRFNAKYSLQVAPSFFYYNSVETGLKNANFSVSAGGRAKILGNAAIIAEYDYLFTKQERFDPKPNLALGVEIGTATHCFQVFAANYSQIINQRNLLYNTNDFSAGDFLFGFNITVRF
jgi:hypothetical protein